MLCKELETRRRLPSLLLPTLFFTTTTPNGDDPHKNNEEEEEGAKAKVPPRHFPACSISPAISTHQIPSTTSNPTNFSTLRIATQTSYAGTQIQKPTTQKAMEPLKWKNSLTQLTHPTKTKLECVWELSLELVGDQEPMRAKPRNREEMDWT